MTAVPTFPSPDVPFVVLMKNGSPFWRNDSLYFHSRALGFIGLVLFSCVALAFSSPVQCYVFFSLYCAYLMDYHWDHLRLLTFD
jgi:hypothetical protein